MQPTDIPPFIPVEQRAQPIARAAVRYHDIGAEVIALALAVIALVSLWAIGRALIGWVVS